MAAQDSTPTVGGDPFLRGAALALGLVSALAWLGLLGQGSMADGSTAMERSPTGALAYLAAWGVMMAAMMLPSAVPMVALYAATARGARVLPTGLFAATYLVAWVLVGVPVYLASVGLAAAADSSDAVMAALPYGAAIVLIAAGVYQFTPLKTACLRACRSPLGFLLGHWRSGPVGALRMGLAHAVYCVGCCAGLMAVLVAAGAMGLAWALGIALVVFLEKVAPAGGKTARVVGVALVLLGVLALARPEVTMALRGGAM